MLIQTQSLEEVIEFLVQAFIGALDLIFLGFGRELQKFYELILRFSGFFQLHLVLNATWNYGEWIVVKCCVTSFEVWTLMPL